MLCISHRALGRSTLLAIGLVALLPCLVHACSCEFSSTPLIELERADVVFTGEVVEIEERDAGRFGNIYYVHLRIGISFKGMASREATVVTELEEAACGYSFAVGEEYLVYAYTENVYTYELGFPKVSLCSRTKPASEAGAEIDELRRATAVAESSWSRVKEWILGQMIRGHRQIESVVRR